MRRPGWSNRYGPRLTLSNVYDADRRTTDPRALEVAARMPVPHPLRGVAYADGTLPKPNLLRIVDPMPDVEPPLP